MTRGFCESRSRVRQHALSKLGVGYGKEGRRQPGDGRAGPGVSHVAPWFVANLPF